MEVGQLEDGELDVQVQLNGPAAHLVNGLEVVVAKLFDDCMEEDEMENAVELFCNNIKERIEEIKKERGNENE